MAKKRMKNYHVLISLQENPQIRNIRDFYLRQVQWAVLNFFGNCVRSTTNLSLGKEEWIVWIFGR
jgi:hypothetical protein